VTGAPGSRWSGVARHFYWSTDIDQSDSSEKRTYKREVLGEGSPQLMHFGAYWDPGMEFDVDDWDGPFSGDGIRIIKSHTMAHHLPELSEKGYPIVLVYRSDAECYEWWKAAGGFSITYPNYSPYYRDLPTMWEHIVKQNADIKKFLNENASHCKEVVNNQQLCEQLNIRFENNAEIDDYQQNDVKVYVYKK